MKSDNAQHVDKKMGMGRWCSLLGAALIVFLTSLSFDSCSSIECPVSNTVATVYACNDTLKDTLTVRTRRKNGKDSVVLNMKIAPKQFNLPISYQNPVDTFIFETRRLAVIDTVWVHKVDMPHFESVDCGVAYFHELKSVRCTHKGIDSVLITKSFVDYDLTNAHILIYFKARN